MNYGIVDASQLEDIDAALRQDLIANGVSCVLLIDTAGNTIAKSDDGKSQYDTLAFAALAAGNYATVDSLANLVGENEFSLQYHKGEKTSINFSKVDEDLLLISIFDRRISLGLLRLKIVDLIAKIKSICAQGQAAGD